LDFVAAICAGGNPPMYGDCDDARVLGLGGDHRDTATLLAIGSVLFQRADWKSIAGDWTEPAEWLLGSDGAKCFHSLPSRPQRLASRAFKDAGLVLLQDGTAESGISIVFDCGPLGFGSIAAHGHADALSFALRVAGEDVLVDPGTYDYFTYPEWRDYFRSTAAHNTIEIDGVDQSVMLGKFLWGERAQTSLEEFTVDDRGGKVRASHDGYSRLPTPVIHERELHLNGERRAVRISDTLTGAGEHSAKAFFHFAPTCQVEVSGRTALVRTKQGTELTLAFDRQFELAMLRGSESPRAGWFSDSYHHKTPAPTLIASAQWHSELKAETQIVITKFAASRDRSEMALAAEC
jgi:hypothetical protein